MTEIPRRCYVDRSSPGENAIRLAIDAVESMGADVRLTDVVIRLGEARERLADYVDSLPLKEKTWDSGPEQLLP